jgi:hypothetical protein
MSFNTKRAHKYQNPVIMYDVLCFVALALGAKVSAAGRIVLGGCFVNSSQIIAEINARGGLDTGLRKALESFHSITRDVGISEKRAGVLKSAMLETRAVIAARVLISRWYKTH